MNVVRWGVIGTGKIGRNKVIPAMQQGRFSRVDAIASRDGAKARAVAERLALPRAYGSYEALLTDNEIEAVYITLPNHLHVPMSIAALEAGKHVLCEKPIGLDAADAARLADAAARSPRLKVMEAFMYRHHPQWERTRALIESGAVGRLSAIHSVFSYYNDDENDICNQPALGGGGLLDIGCYSVSLSRWLFAREPTRVVATADRDPVFGTDTRLSAFLDFGVGTSQFTCGTKLVPLQRVQILGTEGRIELDVPFSAPPDQPQTIRVQRGRDVTTLTIDPVNQYTLQGDRFSQAILEETPVPTSLADAVANMRVIDRLFQSAATGIWA
jgi:predicted dehydrogenase